MSSPAESPVVVESATASPEVNATQSPDARAIEDLKNLYESNEKFEHSEAVQYKNNGENSWTTAKISDVYDPSYGIQMGDNSLIQNINKSNLRYLFGSNQKVIVRIKKSESETADTYTYSRTTVKSVPIDITSDELKYTTKDSGDVSVYDMVPDRKKPVVPATPNTGTSSEISSVPLSTPTLLPSSTSVSNVTIQGMGMYLTDVKMKNNGTFESVGAESYMQETNGKKYKLVVNNNGTFDKIEIVTKAAAPAPVSAPVPEAAEQQQQQQPVSNTATQQQQQQTLGGAPRYRTIQKRYQPKNKTRKFKYLRRYLA